MEYNLLKDSIFKELQFTEKWIKLGIVNSENFIKLKARYLQGDDTNTEHYRWEAFRNFIKDNKQISQQLLSELYYLGKNDPNIAMGTSMRFSIINFDNCPEDLINLALEDEYKGLSKHALKVKDKRSKNLS